MFEIEPLSLDAPILIGLMFTLVINGAPLMDSGPMSLRKIVGLASIPAEIAIISMEKESP